MSTFSRVVSEYPAGRSSLGHLYRAFFDDRIGLTIFLTTVAATALYWRVGIFINDNYTIANTLVNVAGGRLHVATIVYGPETGATPGMVVYDGQRFGRNYGLVFAALPVLWLLQILTTVTSLPVLLAGLWSLLVITVALQLGALFDRHRVFAIAGAIVALITFIFNLAVATPLPPPWTALVALQVSSMVWAGLLAVLAYRLLTLMHDGETGLFAGLAIVLATPVGFWASIPKRHVLISLLVVLVLYCFYRSRSDADRPIAFRALAYLFAGLSVWVFPLEGTLVLTALVPIDLATAPSNRSRNLLAVGLAFLLGIAPFLLTNAFISGNPLLPPGLLPSYTGAEQLSTGSTGGSGGSSSGGTSGTTGGATTPIVSTVLLIADTAVARLDLLWSKYLSPGAGTLLTEPDRLYHTFVHSGYLEGVASEDGGEAINLALLESAPILAGLLTIPAVLARAAPRGARLERWLRSPAGQTDVFALTIAGLFTLVYAPRLPVHAMVTVRYLLPIVPILVYFLARLPPVRRTIHDHARTAAYTYAATVLVGGQLLLIYILATVPARGEAIQLHAWLGLGAAAPLAAWALWTYREPYPRIGAALLAIAAGTTTVFLLLSGWLYFAYAGQFALPIVEWLSSRLAAG